jgi:anaerobic magnesium-protoporphyrin IX monomethyl ester cyclase
MSAMPPRVALVGRRLRDNDNLGLAYLVAALELDGIAVERFTMNGAPDVSKVADAIVAGGFDVAGLSMPDGGSAFLFLGLGELLKRRGFRGHVTAGGPFATLARAWLLARYAWLDSVVRFAGELPLPKLVRAVLGSRPIANIPGVTTRDGDGPPAPVLDRLPLEIVPRRERPPQLLGHGVAHVMATRGCAGRCTYCGPAALQTLALAEAKRGGVSMATARAAGVGGVQRRAVRDVCDEIAALYHEKDVRYFYFVDEHVLPYDEPGAIAFIEELDRGLTARRARPVGFGCMLRAERLTVPMVRAFVRAGLVRAFVGIELASQAEAALYGRRSDPDHGRRILAELDRLGVATVSNLMLVHPRATAETIENGIEFIASVPSCLFEVTRMMVYHGTRLFDLMLREGRLLGNPLRYGYRFDDDTVDRFAEIFVRLRAEAFYDHSLAHRTHDAFLALALARRLELFGDIAETTQALASLGARVHALYVRSYREALALAKRKASGTEAELLVARAARASRFLFRELGACETRLVEELGAPGQIFAPFRETRASALHLLVLGASLSACGGIATDRAAPADAGPPDVSAEARPRDWYCEPDSGTAQVVTERLANATPCFSGYVWMKNPLDGGPLTTQFLGASDSFELCWDAVGNKDRAAAEEQNARAALATFDRSQATCEWVVVDGGTSRDLDRFSAAAGHCVNIMYYQSSLHVVLDPAGNVVAVGQPDGGTIPQDVIDCVRNALSGLTFACLASSEVCPEFICAE